jgi:predicted DNA-binding transcriptional regulator AlpA
LQRDAKSRFEEPVAFNLWFESVIDAWLAARAERRDWREAVNEVERTLGDRPQRVLTRIDLKERKGIPYSRQHIDRLVREGQFPRPFQAGAS